MTISKSFPMSWYVALIVVWSKSIFVNAQTICEPYAMPIELKGKKFFNTLTGEYFPVKGINYYPRPNNGTYIQSNSIDFYTEAFRSVWERDVAYFRSLNINVVRLYAVNPGENHDSFMCALKAAGIYVIVGLAADCFECAITRDPAPACYPESLKSRGEFIIREFARYDNVLGFSAGNEIGLSAASTETNAPCQKQFLRDMRSYIHSCEIDNAMRHIPVGLAVADIDRDLQALYYNCRSDPTDELENAEFYGINSYLHCDGNVIDPNALVGFNNMLSDFQRYQMNIPVMLTEFGCLNPSFPTINGYAAQRNFLQVDTLFLPSFQEEFVGAVVFEYNTELVYSRSPFPFTEYGEGNFGVGYFAPENCDYQGIPCEYVPFPQFSTLASKYAAVDTSAQPTLDSYIPLDRAFPECPAEIPSLSNFQWPSSPPLECPLDLTVYCPGIPGECATPTHTGPRPTSPPFTMATVTSSPTSTQTPTTAGTSASSPTLSPRTEASTTLMTPTIPPFTVSSVGYSTILPSTVLPVVSATIPPSTVAPVSPSSPPSTVSPVASPTFAPFTATPESSITNQPSTASPTIQSSAPSLSSETPTPQTTYQSSSDFPSDVATLRKETSIMPNTSSDDPSNLSPAPTETRSDVSEGTTGPAGSIRTVAPTATETTDSSSRPSMALSPGTSNGEQASDNNDSSSASNQTSILLCCTIILSFMYVILS